MLKRLSLIFITVITLSSCASILNGRTTKVKLYAPKNTQIIFKNDTTLITGDFVPIYPKRSKDSLKIQVANDSIKNDFAFKRKTSGIIYLNILYTYGLGFLVDLNNPKRFTYRKTINIKMDSVSNSFFISEEKLVPFKRNDFFLYTSPLMAIDVFSQPMLSLGGEYFFKDDVSISAEAGLKYTQRLRSNSAVDLVEDRSHSFRMELKWFNIASLTGNGRINEYVGLEARFLRHQFTDDINYTISDGDIFYARNEDFIVQKKVNAFNIKYGLNFPIGKRLYFDLYTGFGIRYKTIKNPNRYYDPAKHRNYDDEDGFLFWPNTNNLEEEGKQKLFNFTLGFKFGVKL